jgi:outer membrane PBP1 activator LpoA protein
MRSWIILITSLLIAGCRSETDEPSVEVVYIEENSCEAAFEAQQSSLLLDYDAFDQTPQQGWRSLGQEECFREAAELISMFLNMHNELTKSERRNLSFHAGQLLAINHDYAEAIPYFENALNESEAEDASFKWNAYVNATIAFLRKDTLALQGYRAEIAESADPGGTVPNLDVVDGLLQNMDKPYREAYGAR